MRLSVVICEVPALGSSRKMSNVNVIYISGKTASSSVSPAAATMDPNYCSNHFLAESRVSDRGKYYPSSSYSLSASRRRCPGLPLLHTISDWLTVGLTPSFHRTRLHTGVRKKKRKKIKWNKIELLCILLKCACNTDWSHVVTACHTNQDRQSTVYCMCAVKGHSPGGSQHIICSPMIFLCCLSNKESQRDRQIVSL